MHCICRSRGATNREVARRKAQWEKDRAEMPSTHAAAHAGEWAPSISRAGGEPGSRELGARRGRRRTRATQPQKVRSRSPPADPPVTATQDLACMASRTLPSWFSRWGDAETKASTRGRGAERAAAALRNARAALSRIAAAGTGHLPRKLPAPDRKGVPWWGPRVPRRNRSLRGRVFVRVRIARRRWFAGQGHTRDRSAAMPAAAWSAAARRPESKANAAATNRGTASDEREIREGSTSQTRFESPIYAFRTPEWGKARRERFVMSCRSTGRRASKLSCPDDGILERRVAALAGAGGLAASTELGGLRSTRGAR